MAASIIDQFDYKGQKQNFKRDAFDTIFEMTNFSENYLPPIFEAFCYETGLKYRYNISNPNDPVLKKWREVADGSGDLPTASATVKGGAKIGTSLEIKNEVLDVKVPTDENFTTELKEKLEDIDMDTKVDVEEGKGLSTNDLTDELKEQYDKAQQNVQSDWDQTNQVADDYIKNKPTRVSDFDNDAEFITKAVSDLENYYIKSKVYSKDEIDSLLMAINQFNVYLVDELPEFDIDDHAIYFCKKKGATTDFYEEFIYVQEVWRKIGDTQISLDDYYTKTKTDELLAKKLDNDYGPENAGKTVMVNAQGILALTETAGGSSVLTQAIKTNVECGGIPSGTNFEVGTSLEDIFNKLLVKYINPSVSLKLSVGSLRAKWSPLTSVTLTSSGSKGTSDIADIKLYDGSTLIETQTSFGAYAYTPAASITANTTFKAIVSDVQGKTAQATYSVSFIIPYYYGVSADASLTDPTTLTEDLSSKGNKTYKFTANEKYFYLAYDYSYGSLTSILDATGFENLGNFTKVGKVTVTKNGKDYDLMVYRSNTVQTQTNFSLTFKL
ncbi:MAG: hypothetical protein MJZ37_00010 [Bacilli bacterium]|nr:hypothetical protein [Bacilli bacterium]